jgi:hypothetical protein
LVVTTSIAQPDKTEFVVVPEPVKTDGGRAGAVAVLAPKWRDVRVSDPGEQIGWTRVTNETRLDVMRWAPLNRSSSGEWAADLDAALAGDVAYEVLLGTGNGAAHVVQVPASGAAQYIGTESGTVVRSVDGTPPEPWVLDSGALLTDALDLGPDVSMTLLAQARRTAADGPLNAHSERRLQMSVVFFRPDEGRPVIGAVVQTASGRLICGTHKPVREATLRRYAVAAVCPVPLSTGEKSLWLVGHWNIGEPVGQDLHLTVDVERAEGTVTTSPLTQRAGGTLDQWIDSSNPSPYARFVIRGIDPFEGTPTDPWVWPAQWLPTP